MHRFGPVGHLELAQDVGDVIAYRLRAQNEAGSDFGIGLALGNQGQNFVFALRQFREELRGSTLCAWSRAAEIVHQVFRDGWTKDGLAITDGANGT